MKKITSRSNPTFKLLHELSESGRERRKQGRVVLDGVHLVQAYLATYGQPELIAVSEHGAEQPEIASLVATMPHESVVAVAEVLFREISPVTTPTGILALARTPSPPPLAIGQRSCVVLEDVQDAGNVGSILRSAAAAGIEIAVLGRGCAQAWSPRVLRAGMGAHFALTIHEHVEIPGVLLAYGGTVVTTQLGATDSLYDVDLSGPVAWVFGNEGAGLSNELSALAHRHVEIPMSGKVESLNVAAAAAVCLFEERRQKLRKRAGRA